MGSVKEKIKLGAISTDSPVGKAILGKKEGDEVVLDKIVGRKVRFRIKKVY